MLLDMKFFDKTYFVNFFIVKRMLILLSQARSCSISHYLKNELVVEHSIPCSAF